MKKVLVLVLLCGVLVQLQKVGYEFTPLNRAFAAVKVWNDMELEFGELSSSLKEADIVRQYAGIKLDCGDEDSPMGDRSCYSHIRTANGADAWFVAFFFEQDRLMQVKLDMKREGHAKLLDEATRLYGRPRDARNDQNGVPIGWWILDRGILSTNTVAYEKGTSQYLWIAKGKLAERFLERLRDRTRDSPDTAMQPYAPRNSHDSDWQPLNI